MWHLLVFLFPRWSGWTRPILVIISIPVFASSECPWWFPLCTLIYKSDDLWKRPLNFLEWGKHQKAFLTECRGIKIAKRFNESLPKIGISGPLGAWFLKAAFENLPLSVLNQFGSIMSTPALPIVVLPLLKKLNFIWSFDSSVKSTLSSSNPLQSSPGHFMMPKLDSLGEWLLTG